MLTKVNPRYIMGHMFDDVFTVKDLIEAIGISKQAIVMKIKRGKIKATKIGSQYLIEGNEFRRILKQYKKDADDGVIEVDNSQ